MNTEPTDDQINRGIAEWRGENVICVHSSCIVVAEKSGGRTKPLLTKSHDACHEALERMTEEQVEAYLDHMLQAINSDVAASEEAFRKEIKAFICATARQKALAIYRTITTKP